ncbi:hypothetical protein PtA15_11A204 [Puccinia triticina]|uniref:Uncharacterized protein n=1 Tax=Puccinia triticina TaxID=208348 RepID=A0ABY7CX31_9BASI|nr:uncharacterized protein PtA15_11A204 [Puccinia triticina]WAQ89515.1 hypothetical protein PtA15_11A204 [Puccinia triticina]
MVPVQSRQPSAPNSLRMIRRGGTAAPLFPEPIHKFTIPGNTRAEAEDFVTAMQTTVYWNKKRYEDNDPALKPSSGRTGRPAEAFFRLAQEPSARSLIASEAQDTTVGRPVKKPRKPMTRALASQLPPHAEPREDPTHADEPAEVDEGLLGFDAGGLTNQHGCPSMPPPLPANNLYLTEDEIKRHLSNLLASLVNALKLTNNILKVAKNQRLVLSRVSPDWMWGFKDSCERILTHITYKCPKASKPRYVSFPGISVVQCLPRDEVDKLTSQLQEAGVKWLKTAEGLLTHKDHKDDCLANCTVEDLEQLRTDGWEILGSVENMLPQKDLRKQIR